MSSRCGRVRRSGEFSSLATLPSLPHRCQECLEELCVLLFEPAAVDGEQAPIRQLDRELGLLRCVGDWRANRVFEFPPAVGLPQHRDGIKIEDRAKCACRVGQCLAVGGQLVGEETCQARGLCTSSRDLYPLPGETSANVSA